LINSYNQKENLSADELITEQNLEDGIFPWSIANDSKRDPVYSIVNFLIIVRNFFSETFQRKYKIVNTWMLLKRNQEEITIVEGEMFQFLKNIKDNCLKVEETSDADEKKANDVLDKVRKKNCCHVYFFNV